MSSKKSLGFILVVIGFVLIALTGIRTLSTPDIFTHLALGQADFAKTDMLSYTMTGQQWIDMYPLYNKLTYMIWSLGGAGLLTIIHVLISLIAFILMFRFGKNWGGPLSQSLALLLCAWLLLPVFSPSPVAFFTLFTALFITLLYRVKQFGVLAATLLALQILWTNIHPSFLFGPALILFFAFENWQETKNASRTGMVTPLTARLLGLAGTALAVTLINPNLINLHRHILVNAKLLTGTEGLEWVSLFSSGFNPESINRLTIFALVLGAGGLITQQKRLPVMITMLALVGAFLMVCSVGSLQSFAFLCLPFFILSLNSVSVYLSRTLSVFAKINEDLLTKIMTVITILLMLVTTGALITNRAYTGNGSASRFGLGLEESAFPAAATSILIRKDFPERIINIKHDGGYLALMNPNRKVFCDTRQTLYRPEFYKTLNDALLGQTEPWQTILSDWNPHAVVLNGCWPDAGALAMRLTASKAWKLVFMDGATIILVRDLPEYQSLINDPSIQEYGLKILEESRKKYISQSKGIIKAGNPSRLIGAAGIYLALNRVKEATALYQTLTINSPEMSSAWLGLGRCMILQKQLTKGIGYMEKAAQITPSNGSVWLALHHAYQKKGDQAKIDMAAAQLDKFFTADKATVEQKEAISKKSAKSDAPRPVKTTGPELPAQLQ